MAAVKKIYLDESNVGISGSLLVLNLDGQIRQ